MRHFSLLLAVAGLALTASHASAQCYYIAPPPAPDMRNPGCYYTNPYGVVYGPNYYVRPNFPPYQGVIPAPPGGRGGNGGNGGNGGQLGQYANNPAAYQAAMQQFQAMGGGGGAGLTGFSRHLWARSPRDYFMFDTEPQASPYNYGYVSPAAPAGRGERYDD